MQASNSTNRGCNALLREKARLLPSFTHKNDEPRGAPRSAHCAEEALRSVPAVTAEHSGCRKARAQPACPRPGPPSLPQDRQCGSHGPGGFATCLPDTPPCPSGPLPHPSTQPLLRTHHLSSGPHPWSQATWVRRPMSTAQRDWQFPESAYGSSLLDGPRGAMLVGSST